MASAVPIQLALQGGGAKIVHLIATLEAVERLEKLQKIRVTRLAGTSAGAIAACLFAARIPMSTVKEALRNFRSELTSFPEPTLSAFVWNVLAKGRPLASTSSLEALLDRLFKDAKVDLVSSLPVPVTIVSADLFTGKPHEASEGDSLTTALMDSCAIPFYFRLWSHARGGHVDGGLCENLPVEKLKTKDQDKYGPVIAVSFKRPRTVGVHGLKKYASALLDTAIYNSEERSRHQLVPDSIFPIETDIETFNFEAALSDTGGLGDAYTLTRNSAEVFFKTYLDNREGTVIGDLWAAQSPDTMQKLAEIYQDQHIPSKHRVERATIVVQANCLLQKGEVLAGVPDQVTYRRVFWAGKDPIYCQKIGLTSASDSRFLGQAQVSVLGPRGQTIRTTILPAANVKSMDVLAPLPSTSARALLVFFHPPLPVASGPYTLRLEEWVENAMSKLKARERDDIYISKLERAGGPVDRVDLVLKAPISYGEIKFLIDPDSNQGKKMEDGDAAEFGGPGHFRSFCWSCKNADPARPSRVYVEPD